MFYSWDELMEPLKHPEIKRRRGVLFLGMVIAVAIISIQSVTLSILRVMSPVTAVFFGVKMFIVMLAYFAAMLNTSINPVWLADHFLTLMYINQAEQLFVSTMNSVFF